MKHTNIFRLVLCLAMLLGGVGVSWGQTLSASGNWSKTTVSTQTVMLTGNVTMQGTVTIPNGVTLTINGNNKTIKTYTSTTATPSSFVIEKGGKLVMSNVTLEGGNPSTNKVGNTYGGGSEGAVGAGEDFTNYGTAITVYDNAQLELTDVTAQNLCSKSYSAFIYAVNGNGEVKDEAAKITMTKVNVDNCLSKSDDGIIYTGGTYMVSEITMTNCAISNCMVKREVTEGGVVYKGGTSYGGVIKGAGGTNCVLNMTNCTMEYCWGSGWGGAILWAASGQGAKASFNNCTFENNYARYLGGAISTEATIELENCTINNNTAGFGGGGIAAFPFTIEAVTGQVPNVGLILKSGNKITNNKTLFVTNYNGQNVTEGCNVKSNSQTITQENSKGFNPRYTLLNATDVWYPSGGGGIYVLMNKNLWNADMDFSASGNIISNNTSASEGGGIYLYKQKPHRSAEATDTGIYVEGQEKAVFLDEYKDNSGVVGMKLAATISNNTTAFSGGGVAVGADNSTSQDWTYPSVTVTGGEIKLNTASNGNGGGVYMPGGVFTIEGGSITQNKALVAQNVTASSETGNGGGIAITEGEFEVETTDFVISQNEATRYGGGLYVFKATKDVTFSGGTFQENTALAGGGVSLEGTDKNNPVTLNMSANVQYNKAENGGGFYLNNYANLVVEGGLLRNNEAGDDKTGTLTTKTASGKKVTEVKGVGGGVFLDDNTSLSFDVADNELGFYGNHAVNAADDIFANGSNTKVSLPDVATMNLSEFSVPAGELFWTEDYYSSYKGSTYESDASYSSLVTPAPTFTDPAHNLRYRFALQNLKRKHIVEVPSGTFENKYVCLALGYQIFYVTIKKTGLNKGESALFGIYSEKTGTNPYITMLLTGGESNSPVEKKVALPEGTWKVTEQTGWSWTYGNNAPSVEKEVKADNILFEFTNTKNSTGILHDEDIEVNKMGQK